MTAEAHEGQRDLKTEGRREGILDKIDKINEIVGGSGKAVAGYWWLVSVAAVYDRRGCSGFRRSQTRRYRGGCWFVDQMSVRA